MNSSQDDTLTFVTLGDGDFSYSVDVATYLAEKTDDRSRLIATGIDSLEELQSKYRNAPFLLKTLENLGKKNASLSISIRHSVNAVQVPPEKESAHHVIFNHPHVGTEDAALHAAFLSHLLYTCSVSWMKDPGGVLHLTLVKGQYERWDCEAAARRHKLVLLERNPFVPPPGGHYQHRRHQTGKSFASRASGSETFTFGRSTDTGKYIATCLPWQTRVKQQEEYPCPHCDKSFGQERSRTSHIKAVHDNEKQKKVFECEECKAMNVSRTFCNEEALADHVRAKHSNQEKIQPDWAKDQIKEQTQSQEEMNGSCSICGMAYRNDDDEANHSRAFVPASHTDDESNAYACAVCHKRFRDRRAQLQHQLSAHNDSTES